MKVILNRLLLRLEDLKREVDLGDGRKLIVDYGDLEKRQAASVTQGEVIGIGPDAYKDWGYNEPPVKIGDIVQIVKFAGRAVLNPDNPTDRLAVINDEDVIAIIKSKENTNE